MSASEIIKELPKLSEAERQAVLDKLRELAQVDDDRWEEIISSVRRGPNSEPLSNRRQPKAASHSI